MGIGSPQYLPIAQIAEELYVPPQARPLIRHSALMAQAAQSPNLKKRTLTNLYNDRPTWLKLAHEKLERAVLAAYAAIDPEGHWSEDWAPLYTETGAGTPLPDSHPDHAARLATDQKILTNLLRLNHERATPQETHADKSTKMP